jgi:hypothetical protein
MHIKRPRAAKALHLTDLLVAFNAFDIPASDPLLQ